MAQMKAFVSRGEVGALKPGEQMVRFWVWPKGEEDKRVPLFRARVQLAGLDGIIEGKLSGFWEDMRTAMWPHFDKVKDVEKLKANPNAKEHLRAWEMEGKERVTALPEKLSYKPTDTEGAFCFDANKGTSLPLQKANVSMVIRAMRNQFGNPDTLGQEGDGGLPRRLWIAGLPDQDEEGDAYEEALKTFESWAEDEGDKEKKIPRREGKIVYWKFEEIEEKPRR